MPPLGPEAAQIFRITHVRNVPWILAHGLHCRASKSVDPDFISIGSSELISKRAAHPVPIAPGGTLGEYVPFYFTPWSIMMYNIRTGYGGITKRPNGEIVMLVSSLPRLAELGLPFVFTNGHAYMAGTEYFDTLAEINQVDWALLRSKNFKRDPEHPERFARYQAEALVHHHVPVEALVGIGCYDEQTASSLTEEVANRGLKTPVKAIPGWYF
ncbi:MAG: DUF4433 domain-containing protein [Phycisphaerae bacterium]|nr:DUF4433 domain-containing protein [Phycisphaerae bacterium]